MRNLFDQYTHPENRLTHALAVCLNEDRALLKAFLRWIGVSGPREAHKLVVTEQNLPGDPPSIDEEDERRGLPDVVIHDGESWCTLIESKIQARLSDDQLSRHQRTLKRRDFNDVHVVALTKDGVEALNGCIAVHWDDLYEWLGQVGSEREWPERLRNYLRAAEVRMARDGYLVEGTLTKFDGFPFNDRNPYTYGEAKRLLKLVMAELRRDRRLLAMGMDPNAEGRTAITGRSASSVWDFLSFNDRPRHGGFTRYPHLTLGVSEDDVGVAVTIPNGVVAPVRDRMLALGVDGLATLNAGILRRAKSIIERGGRVESNAVQRHYRSQRSAPDIDARVVFKLETSQPRSIGIKHQPEWAQLFFELIERKRSNVQFQYVVKLPWGTRGLDNRESLTIIVDAWCALEPLLMVLRGR